MSFEIQELPDVIKIISLLILQEKGRATKKTLKDRLDKICSSQVCVDSSDFEEALKEMRSEDLVHVNEFDEVRLTDRGALLSIEWEKLFVGDEPVMETVAGLTDGSITSLVVILSSFLTGLISGNKYYVRA